MVLVVNGTPLQEAQNFVEELYNRFPSLVEEAAVFAAQPVVTVAAGRALYVAQGEFAIVPRHDRHVGTVGSDDATTCHVIILKSRNGTVVVGHFDGGPDEETSLRTIMKKVESIDMENCTIFELYVAGGYSPAPGTKEALKGASSKLSTKLLKALTCLPQTFVLRLWCTGHANTILSASGPRPIVHGLCYQRDIGGVVMPAQFTLRGPNLALRSAARNNTGGDAMIEIYDANCGNIVIRPFSYHPTEYEFLAYYLTLSDSLLLKNCSTSPDAEPPHFCADLRAMFRVYLEHPRPDLTLFPNNKPIRHLINDEGVYQSI